MSYQPLHHKYRPQTFAELVGQGAIATTLTNAIDSARIAPAYLFAGPRGTGKTSSARILAKSLNCLDSEVPTASPCGICEVCRAIAVGSAMDVIEIDAASNTGVDNIRDIIERSQFAPVQCRYKVYAIDECHMLSVAAFNALLKTLEEPPKRVVFILATTDPQRVLPTIISRTQRFDFRRIGVAEMVNHLSKIANLEKINIDPQAVTLVAQLANGGLRDAQSLLDQLSLLTGEITSDRVWDLVGAVGEIDLLAMLGSIRSNQPDLLIAQCRSLIDRGREPIIILQNLANFYLNLAIAKTAPQSKDLVAVTASTWEQLKLEAEKHSLDSIFLAQKQLQESEFQIKNSNVPRLWLEITLLGLLPKTDNNSKDPTTEAKATNGGVKPSSSPSIPPILKYPKIIRTPKPAQPKPTAQTTAKNNSEVVSLPKSDRSKLDTKNTFEIPKNQVNFEGLSLEDTWQKVLKNIEPSFIQANIRTHSKLIALEASAATIEVESKKLYNNIRNYVAKIETAFAKVLAEKIVVTLQVKKNEKLNPTNSRSDRTISNSNFTGSLNTVNNSSLETISKPKAIPCDRPPEKKEIPAKPHNSSPISNSNESLDISSEVDLEECAERFAKFFEGKQIDLDDLTADINE